ncbi:MAG: hypothetical protein AAGH68_08145 [Pseudomonadota bacterium]
MKVLKGVRELFPVGQILQSVEIRFVRQAREPGTPRRTLGLVKHRIAAYWNAGFEAVE